MGVRARYSIPAFRPLAGFSPSCCAVFVHMEHCECKAGEMINNPKHSKTVINNFIIQIYTTTDNRIAANNNDNTS
jgi:hypothetical protein